MIISERMCGIGSSRFAGEPAGQNWELLWLEEQRAVCPAAGLKGVCASGCLRVHNKYALLRGEGLASRRGYGIWLGARAFHLPAQEPVAFGA